MTQPRTLALALITITAALLAGCAATPVGSERTTTPQPSPEVTVNPTPPTPAPVGAPTVLASDLTTPWSAVFVGETALISSRDTGEILELIGDTTRLVGLVPGVVQVGESGLLGLAVDDQRRLYATPPARARTASIGSR